MPHEQVIEGGDGRGVERRGEAREDQLCGVGLCKLLLEHSFLDLGDAHMPGVYAWSINADMAQSASIKIQTTPTRQTQA